MSLAKPAGDRVFAVAAAGGDHTHFHLHSCAHIDGDDGYTRGTGSATALPAAGDMSPAGDVDAIIGGGKRFVTTVGGINFAGAGHGDNKNHGVAVAAAAAAVETDL